MCDATFAAVNLTLQTLLLDYSALHPSNPTRRITGVDSANDIQNLGFRRSISFTTKHVTNDNVD